MYLIVDISELSDHQLPAHPATVAVLCIAA